VATRTAPAGNAFLFAYPNSALFRSVRAKRNTEPPIDWSLPPNRVRLRLPERSTPPAMTQAAWRLRKAQDSSGGITILPRIPQGSRGTPLSGAVAAVRPGYHGLLDSDALESPRKLQVELYCSIAQADMRSSHQYIF
jgi:hypothetical protein